MTRVFLALFILPFLLAVPASAADCGTMPVGFHEFAIFGGGKHIFISHYPMFSSVHAYQVLLEVELSGEDHDAARKFLDHQAAHPELRYTFSPYRKTVPAADRIKDQDDWVLPEKSRVGSSINGDIHYREGDTDTTLDFNVGAKVVERDSKQIDVARRIPAQVADLYSFRRQQRAIPRTLYFRASEPGRAKGGFRSDSCGCRRAGTLHFAQALCHHGSSQ